MWEFPFMDNEGIGLVKIKTNENFENLVSIFSVTIIIIMIMMFMK